MGKFPRNVYPDHALIVALHVFANFKNASEALEEIVIEAIGLSPSKRAMGWSCWSRNR